MTRKEQAKMYSPQQNVGQSAAAPRNSASRHAQQTDTLTSGWPLEESPSTARARYESLSHLSRADAIKALVAQSEAEKITVNSIGFEDYSRLITLIATEGEIENRKKEARVASTVLFELLEEMPTADDARLAVLRSEIVTLGSYADQAQNRVEQLQGELSRMIADL